MCQCAYTQGRRQRGGQWCSAPLFEICAPHFTFGPLVAAYFQYTIFKMCAPLLAFGPSFYFSAPLLVNPGDGPAYTYCIVFVSQTRQRTKKELPNSYIKLLTYLHPVVQLVQMKVIITSHDFGPDYTLH